MVAETSKELDSVDNAIKFYLKGIAYEPVFLDNLIDFAQVCFGQGESSFGNMALLFAKILENDSELTEESHVKPEILTLIETECQAIRKREMDSSLKRAVLVL